MQLRTHLAIGIFFALMLAKYFENKWVFILMVLIGTIIPDLDSSYSSFGRFLIFRPFQFFIKHRGLIHSFTFAVLLSLIFYFFWNVGWLGFFIGYSAHLIADCFTKSGVRVFWPLDFKVKGFLRTGGVVDELLFIILVIINLILIVKIILGL